jgi:serine/threonine protein kinase
LQLKPDNLGFSVDNVVKLFDFGLAKTLVASEQDADGLYRNMTQFTGAARYMAPEVATSDRYNLAADVYSWSMLFWYILVLEPPFGLLPHDVMMQRVLVEGHRPYIQEKWPPLVQKLLQSGWAQEISKRPVVDKVIEGLQEVLGEGW